MEWEKAKGQRPLRSEKSQPRPTNGVLPRGRWPTPVMAASDEEPGFIAIIQTTLRCLIFLCFLIAIGCLIVYLIPFVLFILFIFFAFLGFLIALIPDSVLDPCGNYASDTESFGMLNSYQ
ncbi:hypothetical protein BGZ61DRAFT_528209 [Ilyonectria robusta]|uniref:uncharacterized protein n=1 Tax=Ilyonectria robusta TaxID=1079257 RepID=UPI001E8E30DE|nr:uncharacterized protein BGZ61DRAFT_528209 [Ilyonectria robusta]KAH8734947.1 hypothetical protein BGZ61DRAFT_528209 [Ilyonectria robusta]